MKFVGILFLLLISGRLMSQEGDEVFTFLRYPSSAHANALGGHTVSLTDLDPSLIFHNPSLLSASLSKRLSMNYMNYLSDIHTGSIVYTQAIGEHGSWGIGGRFFSYGSLKEVTADNIVLGEFTAEDASLNLFYSHDLSDTWRGGISFVGLYSVLSEYTSYGLSVDAGLTHYNEDKGVSVGIVLKNMGAQLKSYDTRREKLPRDIQLGLTKKLAHAPFRISLTAMYLNRWKFDYVDATLERVDLNENVWQTALKHLVIGLDFVPTQNFWLGVGYNPKRAADLRLRDGGNGLGGFSAGAGLKLSRFGIDVSVARHHPSALSLMLGISVLLAAPSTM